MNRLASIRLPKPQRLRPRSETTNMPTTIKIRGFVEDASSPGLKREVDGHAFEIAGFEFMHLWVTPVISAGGFYENWLTVSQWESGKRLSVIAESVDNAIERAREFVEQKGIEACRKQIEPWQHAPLP